MIERPYYSYKLTSSHQTAPSKDSSWIYIGFFVLFLHVFFLGFMQLQSPPLKPSARTKVSVHTVRLNPPHSPPSIQPIVIPLSEISPSLISTLQKEVLAALPIEEMDKVAEPTSDLPQKEPLETKPLPPPISSPPPKKQEPVPKPAVPTKTVVPKLTPKAIPKKENKPAPVKQATKPIPPKPAPKPTLTDLKKQEAQKKEVEKKRIQAEAEKKATLEKKIAEERKQQALAAEQAEKERVKQALTKQKIASVQEKLAQNLQNRKNSNPVSSKLNEASTLQQLEGLQIDAFAQDMLAMSNWSVKEINYQDEVINVLKSSLRLPDFGALKIELTIRKNGKVEKVKILSSESAKNRQYVEQNMTQIQFSAFGNQFEGQESVTFPIILNNEKNN